LLLWRPLPVSFVSFGAVVSPFGSLLFFFAPLFGAGSLPLYVSCGSFFAAVPVFCALLLSWLLWPCVAVPLSVSLLLSLRWCPSVSLLLVVLPRAGGESVREGALHVPRTTSQGGQKTVKSRPAMGESMRRCSVFAGIPLLRCPCLLRCLAFVVVAPFACFLCFVRCRCVPFRFFALFLCSSLWCGVLASVCVLRFFLCCGARFLRLASFLVVVALCCCAFVGFVASFVEVVPFGFVAPCCVAEGGG
jgi:hypothetical protein